MRSYTQAFLLYCTFLQALFFVAYGSIKNNNFVFNPAYVRAAVAMAGDNVELFKEATSSINICDESLVDERWGMSLLHLAALHGYQDIAAYLVANGANKKAKAYSGQTPYDVARAGCKWAVAELLAGDEKHLFEHDENYLEDKKTARIKILKEQIEHGIWDNLHELITLVGPDYRLSLYQPLLHAAVAQANQAQVISLLEAGAHPNLRDSQGNTALHLALKNGSYIIARILLAKEGINLSVKNNHRQNVAHIVREKLVQKHSKRYVTLLRQICGPVDGQNNVQSSSLHYEKPVPPTIVARINKKSH